MRFAEKTGFKPAVPSPMRWLFRHCLSHSAAAGGPATLFGRLSADSCAPSVYHAGTANASHHSPIQLYTLEIRLKSLDHAIHFPRFRLVAITFRPKIGKWMA